VCNIFYRNEKQRLFEERAAQAAAKLYVEDVEGAKNIANELGAYDENDPFRRQTVKFIQGTIALYEKSEKQGMP